MDSPAAIQGDYVDIRFIKGRKVCQIVIEIPIEAGEQFVRAFGTPNPATGVPVAVARINANAEPPKFKGGKLAQRAGMLCSEGAFRKFLSTKWQHAEITDTEAAASVLRMMLGINSRSEIDHIKPVADKFMELEASYKAWLTVAE